MKITIVHNYNHLREELQNLGFYVTVNSAVLKNVKMSGLVKVLQSLKMLNIGSIHIDDL